MYNRIFPVRSILIGSYILGGITLAWLISVDLVAIFQCTPVKKAWLPQTPGTCIDLKVALIANGIPNFVTDILILTLPGRSIWKLQASVWQRVSIIGVFLSGSLYAFYPSICPRLVWSQLTVAVSSLQVSTALV